MLVPLSWNVKSLSDPMSSRTLRIWSLEWCQPGCLLLQWARFLVALYLTFATTTVTHPSSLEEDMLVESPCFDGGKESEFVLSHVVLVLILLVVY